MGKTDPDQSGRYAEYALYCAKGMVERNSGSIVNIASDAARVGSSGEAVYAACKGGLLSFSKTLAREHSRHNIKINVICRDRPIRLYLQASLKAHQIRKNYVKPLFAPFHWVAWVNRMIWLLPLPFLE